MNASQNIPSYYSARPEIFIDDQLDETLSDGVNSLIIEETGEGLSRCEITIVNWGSIDGSSGYLYFRRDILDFAKKISVRLFIKILMRHFP